MESPHDHTKLLPLLDPLFNMRQVCKDAALLEDHLLVPGMFCGQCVRKHMIRCEAYCEEALSLDKDGRHRDLLTSSLRRIRALQSLHASGGDRLRIAQGFRELRKELLPLCFKLE